MPRDTGTGTAFVAAILLDLAIARTSQLPVVIHDLPMFKNIENATVNQLLPIYDSIAPRQSFIAIDEIDKYGRSAAAYLRSTAFVTLRAGEPLYDRDWKTDDVQVAGPPTT